MSDEPAGATGTAPTTGGTAWGDAIDEGRKQELWGRLRAWWDEKEHGERKGPFAGERLTGAEVFWLAVCALAEKAGTSTDKAVERLRAKDFPMDLDLRLLCLNGAVLNRAQLQGAFLGGAQLQEAFLSGAQLQGANLFEAQLPGADLRGAQLQGAVLRGAQLPGRTYPRLRYRRNTGSGRSCGGRT